MFVRQKFLHDELVVDFLSRLDPLLVRLQTLKLLNLGGWGGERGEGKEGRSGERERRGGGKGRKEGG